MIVRIKEAANLTGLTQRELRTGAKQGKYPFFRPGKGGEKAPYMFDIELLTEVIRNECLNNAEKQKELIKQEAEEYPFRSYRINN